MLPYMFDDWIFAQELVHRTRPGLDARLQAFAEEIARRRRQGGYDEFVFMGHSLGCALKLDVADRALRIEAAGPAANRTFNMLSAGSSLLKIALHPAGHLAERCGRAGLAAQGGVLGRFRVDGRHHQLLQGRSGARR